MSEPFTGTIKAKYLMRKGNMLILQNTENKDHEIKIGYDIRSKNPFEKNATYDISITNNAVSGIVKTENAKLTVEV